MSKTKSRTEAEHLKGIIRQLKREVKQLKRQLENSQKIRVIVAAEEDVPTTDSHAECQECGKGQLISTDLGIKTLLACNVCGVRFLVSN